MRIRGPVVTALLLGLFACDGGAGGGGDGPGDVAGASDTLERPGEDLREGPAPDTAPAQDTAPRTDPPAEPSVVLMSGFEPFGGYETNPSMDALWDLEGQVIAGLEVHVVELPVEWDVAWEVLHDAIRSLHPRVVVATGMAGTHAVRYEIRAVNEEWGADNAGVDPEGGPVVADGPEFLAPTIPVQLMSAAVDHAGLPTTLSEDAGTYLCNHVMYRLLHYTINDAKDAVAAGFVHVPPAPYEGPMVVQDITDAHIIGLDVIATWLEDGAPQYKPIPQTDVPPVYYLPGYE